MPAPAHLLCSTCVDLQLAARRRQLLQSNATQAGTSNSTVFAVKFEIPATTTAPAEVVLSAVKEAACDVPGLCDKIGEIVVLSSSPTPVVVNLTMGLVSYAPGNLKLSVVYLENGAAVDVPISLAAASGQTPSCTSVYASGARLFTCDATVTTTALTMVASAVNPSKPAQPLTASVTVSGRGRAAVMLPYVLADCTRRTILSADCVQWVLCCLMCGHQWLKPHPLPLHCLAACASSPCAAAQYSNGVCTPAGNSYSCGCIGGFSWSATSRNCLGKRGF